MRQECRCGVGGKDDLVDTQPVRQIDNVLEKRRSFHTLVRGPQVDRDVVMPGVADRR